MRKLEFINPNGVSTIFGNGSTKFGITSLEGTGIPGVVNQSQRAPYQDGETPIDQLLEPRDIDVEGIFLCGKNRTLEYGYRRELCAALNAKLGVGTLVYTNDYGSWSIGAQLSENGLIFANNNVNDGAMRFMVTFHCPDPYWQDVADTVVTLTTGAADQVVNITGDVQTPVKIDVTGISKYPTIYERLQEKYMQYQQVLDQKLSINTSFGNKTAVLNYNDVWRIRATGPLSSIAYDGNIYCCVGSDGLIITSYDLVTWTERKSYSFQNIQHVIYVSELNLFVAVGDSGTIITSPDGITWTSRIIDVPGWLSGITWSGSLLVAVGYSGAIITSPDGITWTIRTSGTTQGLYDVYYSGGLFVSVGGATILTSPDGITWTSRTSGTSNVVSVTKSSTTWCVVGFGGEVSTSPDGITWTSRTSGTSNNLLFVMFYNSLFYAVGASGTIITSPDGITWTSRTSGTTSTLSGISSFTTSPKLISVGSNVILSSESETGWNIIYQNATYNNISSVVYSDARGIFVAVGDLGTITTSPDGITWTSRTSGTSNNLFSVIYEASFSLFYAVGASGTIITSPDGITWTSRTSGTTQGLTDIVRSASLFVAVGSSGTIITSPDGITWTSRTSGTTESINAIAYSSTQGRLVAPVGAYAFGAIRYMATSIDGITWSLVSSGIGQPMYDVIFSAYISMWVAVGSSSSLYSYDGLSWASGTIQTNTYFAIGYDGKNQFVASIGMSKSSDGKIWSYIQGSPSSVLLDICYSKSKDMFIAVGNGGRIYSSSGYSTTNVIQYMSRDTSWLQLQPGRNVLALSASAGSASATVTYRNRYIGV